MATPYVFVLDGHTFERDEVPARGPFEEFAPQRWSEMDVLGTADPGTILTFLGTKSQSWRALVSAADEATKDKLVAVYNARLPVNFQTPQNGTGFNVLMIEFDVEWREPIENGKFRCEFTLVKRA